MAITTKEVVVTTICSIYGHYLDILLTTGFQSLN